jgi:hypothetical protein
MPWTLESERSAFSSICPRALFTPGVFLSAPAGKTFFAVLFSGILLFRTVLGLTCLDAN